jgi:hypothetical protein
VKSLDGLRDAFARCLQADVAPAARADVGLHHALRAAFPIEVGSGVLVFESYVLEAPRWPSETCLLLGMTWAAPLKLVVQLADRETGDIKEQEIYFGQIPLMTSEGMFVIEGEEVVLDDAVDTLKRALAAGMSDLVAKLHSYEIESIESYMPHDLLDARPLAMALYKAFRRAKKVRAYNPIAQLDHVLGRAPAEPWSSARLLLDAQAPITLTSDEADIARAAGLVQLAGAKGELVVLETGAVVILPSDGSAAFALEPRRWSRRACRAVDRLVRANGAVDASDVVFECDGAKDGKLALGRNARVRFDAKAKKAVVSEAFANAMRASEVFVLDGDVRYVRDGKQTLTTGPGLDESGIIPLGASVKTGDVLVGIASPDLRQLDPSLVVKKGIDGRVVRVDVLARFSMDRSARHEAIVEERERTWKEIERVAAENGDPRWKALVDRHESPSWRNENLPPNVAERVRVTIEREIPLDAKSRLADRHGAIHAIARVAPTLDVDAVLPGSPSAAAEREIDAGGLYLLHLAKKPPKSIKP